MIIEFLRKMDGKTYTILHKSEWDRIRSQSEVLYKKPAEGPSRDKHEYLKALNKKSQEWIKHWPDSVSSRARELDKQKRRQLKKDVASVKAFLNKQKPDSTDAIKAAKQMIFDQTCYGRKIIGALIESRTLKIRDAQIKFKNKVLAETIEQSKAHNESNELNFLNFNDKETERTKLQAIKTQECNTYNKNSVMIKKEKEMEIGKKEKQCTLVDNILKQEMINKEKKLVAEHKIKKEQALKEFEADRKAIRKIKAQREKLNDDLIEVYKKAQDKKNTRIKEVSNEIHKGNSRTKQSNIVFNMVDRIQKDKDKEFKDFVDLAINKCEERRLLEEKEDFEKENEKMLYKHAIAQNNKLAGEAKYANASYANRCVCDRQTILSKNNRKSSENVRCGVEDIHKKILTPDPTFLVSRNKLVDELRLREKERSPWNGTQAAHEQFARNAAAALDKCGHKHLIHKIIGEYKRINNLDRTTTSAIPNYNN